MTVRTIRRCIDLPVAAEAAWRDATTLAGIQRELPRPLRLTTRPRVTTLEQLQDAGAVRAILRIGPVPVLRWHPGIEQLEALRFVEASSDMTWMRSWRHERRIEPRGTHACRLCDDVTFEPAIPGAGRLVAWLFARRHRALRARHAPQ